MGEVLVNVTIDNTEISCRIARPIAHEYGIDIDPHSGEWIGSREALLCKTDVMAECRRVCSGCAEDKGV